MKSNILAALFLFLAATTPSLHAAEYAVDALTIQVSEPDGFLSLKSADEKALDSYYKKSDPKLLDIFCYKDAPPGVGACNYHRTLSLRYLRDYANVYFDAHTFSVFRKGSRARMESECNDCEERAKSRLGVSSAQNMGIFADTDNSFGFSIVYTYPDHKSVESQLIVPIDGKLLSLQARSNVDSKGDIAWTQELLQKWAQQVLTENSKNVSQ